jgi:hypothetical protein
MVELVEKPEAIFGQFGLTKIVYQGTAKGRYKGPETCHWYQVEAGKTLYVDNRDRGQMLLLKDGENEFVFTGA